MKEIKLVEAINSLPDQMIEEAIYARKRMLILRKKWLLPVACLCLLLFAAIGFQNRFVTVPGNTVPPLQNEPPADPLSEQELHSSIYADYCPDYAELGFELYQAEIVCETTFKAIFTSPESELTLLADPLHRENHYLDQLVDVSLTADGEKQQYSCPVFYANQFTTECLDFVKVHRTADGGYTIMFNVIDNDHFIGYVVDSDSLERINRVFECITRCYQ